MKTINKFALCAMFVLSSCTVLPMKKDYSKPDASFYATLGKWMASKNFVTRANIAATARRLKNIDYSKVVEALKEYWGK